MGTWGSNSLVTPTHRRSGFCRGRDHSWLEQPASSDRAPHPLILQALTGKSRKGSLACGLISEEGDGSAAGTLPRAPPRYSGVWAFLGGWPSLNPLGLHLQPPPPGHRPPPLVRPEDVALMDRFCSAPSPVPSCTQHHPGQNFRLNLPRHGPMRCTLRRALLCHRPRGRCKCWDAQCWAYVRKTLSGTDALSQAAFPMPVCDSRGMWVDKQLRGAGDTLWAPYGEGFCEGVLRSLSRLGLQGFFSSSSHICANDQGPNSRVAAHLPPIHTIGF